MPTVHIDFTIEVDAAPLAVDLSGMPPTSIQGEPYTGVAAISGGVPPYTVTPAGGNLPAGLTGSLSGSNFNVTGTPTGPLGSAEATYDVTDSA